MAVALAVVPAMHIAVIALLAMSEIAVAGVDPTPSMNAKITIRFCCPGECGHGGGVCVATAPACSADTEVQFPWKGKRVQTDAVPSQTGALLCAE